MIAICRNKARRLFLACGIQLVCMIHGSFAVTAERIPAEVVIGQGDDTHFAHLAAKAAFRPETEPGSDKTPGRSQDIYLHDVRGLVSELKFTHLTTDDGLSQSNVKTILQDRRGFMWLATQDGLDRYDGNTFVVYKHNPKDPNSISANLVMDLKEDDQGYLWIATYTGGVNRFDPRTERFTRYLHDPKNINSISADSVNSIARDSRGCLWFGTEANGLDKLDPKSGTFTHYLNDSGGLFIGRITHVIEDRHYDIWFVGERGLFHLNPTTGEITRPLATRNGLGADYLYQDDAGNFWILAYSPIVGLVKYDPHKERITTYPVGPGGVGLVSSKLFADEQGIWVPSSLGLYYFDRRTEHLTRLFHHDESNPESLNDDAVISVFQDRGGVLWIGTENGGLNVLNFQQEQFARYAHRPAERTSIAREIHDTLLQSFQGLMLRFEIVSQLLPERPIEAKKKLEGAMKQAADAITEGRDAVQGLRASTVQTNDLAMALNTLGEELANDPTNHGSPAFRVTVEGEPRDLHPILRDETYRIAAEALRNGFHHAQARQIEVEIRYDNQQFRLRVRDDGKGMDLAVLSGHGREGHFGLTGMRERANAIGGKLVVWSEPQAGTEVELRIPADVAYTRAAKRFWLSELLGGR